MPIVSDKTLKPGEKKRGWVGRFVSHTTSPPGPTVIPPDIEEALRAEKQWVREDRSTRGQNRVFWTFAAEPTRAAVPEYVAAVESSVAVNGEVDVSRPDTTGARYAVFRQVLKSGVRLSVTAVREGLLTEGAAKIEGVESIDLTQEDPLSGGRGEES